MSDYTNLILTNNGVIYKGPATLSKGDMIENETGSLRNVKGCLFVMIGSDIWNFLLEANGVEDFPTYKAYYRRHEESNG